MASATATILDRQEHDNDNMKSQLIAASAICLFAAYIAVILRFVARNRASNLLEADDYTILLALFFTSILVVTVLIGVHYGLGRNWILVTNGIAYTKAVLAATILYSPAIATTKFSILLLYQRIFPTRSFVISLWCVGAFVAAYSMTATMANLLQCLTIRADWNPNVQPRCVDLRLQLIILGSSLAFASGLLCARSSACALLLTGNL